MDNLLSKSLIESMQNFLFRRQDPVTDSLWGESFEDSLKSDTTVISLWGSSDVALALLYSGKNNFQSEIVIRELQKSLEHFQLVWLEIEKKYNFEIENELNEMSNSIINFNDQIPKNRLKLLMASITDVLKTAQIYYGIPRTVLLNEASGPADFILRGNGVANSIVGCSFHRFVRDLQEDNGTDNGYALNQLKSWYENFPWYLASPELSVLKKTLETVEAEVEAKFEENTSGDRLKTLFKKIVTEYTKNIDTIVSTELYPSGTKFFEINAQIKPGDYDKRYEKLLKQITGCELNDTPPAGMSFSFDKENKEPKIGWAHLPGHGIGFNDPITSLYVLETLTGAWPKIKNSNDELKVLGGINVAITNFHKGLLELSGAESVSDHKIKLNIHYSESIGFLARSALCLSLAKKNITNEFYLKKIDQLKANPSIEIISKLISDQLQQSLIAIYVALLARTYRIVYEQGAVPAESVPTEMIANHEITHWPGIDVGFVSFALLIARKTVTIKEMSEYVCFKEYEIFFLNGSIDTNKVITEDHPLFVKLIGMTLDRVVTPQLTRTLIKEGQLSKQELLTNRLELEGGFLSVYGWLKGVEQNPKIYLWSTAHSLSAIAKWVKDSDGRRSYIDNKDTITTLKNTNTELENTKNDINSKLDKYSRAKKIISPTKEFILSIIVLIISLLLNNYEYFPIHIHHDSPNAVNLINRCAFDKITVKNDHDRQKKISEFKSKFELKKNECAILIVNTESTPDEWKIAGFNDKNLFREELVKDPSSKLLVELKKKQANNSNIVELVTSTLGRTLPNDVYSNLWNNLFLLAYWVSGSLAIIGAWRLKKCLDLSRLYTLLVGSIWFIGGGALIYSVELFIAPKLNNNLGFNNTIMFKVYIPIFITMVLLMLKAAIFPPKTDPNNPLDVYITLFFKFIHTLNLCLITAFETDADKLDGFRRRYDNPCSNTEKKEK